jgi:hypothetical protein
MICISSAGDVTDAGDVHDGPVAVVSSNSVIRGVERGSILADKATSGVNIDASIILGYRVADNCISKRGGMNTCPISRIAVADATILYDAVTVTGPYTITGVLTAGIACDDRC